MRTSLTKEQKESIGLLSIGTFLEYFDLMLYVHMAILLNELFFPKSDPYTTSLVTAFAFCSTYILRPFGALVFGWIGDNIGRKATVIITTTMMAASCFAMAILPTYAQIGIAASWIVSICRVVQGLTSMGERIGAELYLTEIIKPPAQYPAVSSVAISGTFGASFALGVASVVTLYNFNWRFAFIFGMIVAIVGAIARKNLKETPEFVDARRRIKKILGEANMGMELLSNNAVLHEKVNKITAFSLFLIQCSWPVWFYFTYMYCGTILKNSFGFSPEQIIHQNFIVSIIESFQCMIVAYLSYKIYPLKILKIMISIMFIFTLLCPYLLDNINSPFELLLIQSFVVLFSPGVTPAMPIFFKYFPVFKRFTYGSFVYALARLVMYGITSFGIVILTEHFHNLGMLIIMIPTCVGYAFGVMHFTKLEKKAEVYHYQQIPA
jgi:MFS family permease